MNTNRAKVHYTQGLLVLVLVLGGVPTQAQDLYVYPAKGQSDKQLMDDRYACHLWAVQESGFDPSQLSEATPPRVVKVPVGPNPKEGATEKGTLVGAVAGGIIGSQSHRAGEGAVIGAVVGAIAGSAVEQEGRRETREEAEREAEALAKSKAEKALRRSDYRRAITACLEGRGYTVK